MDGGVGALSAFSSALTATIRVSQTIYELKAVDEQARDLLGTTTHVDSTLSGVRALRRQKSTHLSPAEKKWIDDIVSNTDKTLTNVCALIEPARVDMRTKFGKVGFKNKVAFILRDSPRVGTNLARLCIASQSLNTAMGVLCGREGAQQVLGSPGLSGGGWDEDGDGNSFKHRGSTGRIENMPPPPAYAEIMRRRDEKRKFSAGNPTTPGSDAVSSDVPPVNKAFDPLPNPTVATNQPPSIIMSTNTIYPKPVLDLNFKPDDDLIVVETAEVMPSPSLESITCQPSKLSLDTDGADGLQVAMPNLPEVSQGWDTIGPNANARFSSSTFSIQSQSQSRPGSLRPGSSQRASFYPNHNHPAQLTPGATPYIDPSPQPYEPLHPYPDSTTATAQYPPQSALYPNPKPSLNLHKSLPPISNSNSNLQLPLHHAPSPTTSLQTIDSVASTHILQPHAHALMPRGSSGSGSPGNGTGNGDAVYSARREIRGRDRRGAWLEWQASR